MKKRTRKLLALFAVCALALSLLAGCGSSSDEETTADESAAAEETADAEAEEETASEETSSGEAYKIAMIQQHQTNEFQITITEAAEAKAEELGIELTIFDANQDVATQISQIEQCVSEEYDAIIFEPVDPDGLVDAAVAALDAGVVVINGVSAITDWEENGIYAFSGGSNVEAGEIEMQAVVDALGGEGQIAIITGPSTDSGGLDRYEGYMNVLENYPDIEIVVEADCEWDTSEAQDTVESWLVAYDLDAIVSENDGMAVGAANAAGEDSGILITGVDATSDGLEAIEAGTMYGTVSQDPGLQGENAIEAAVAILNGETLEETEILTECIWVTADNLSDFQ